MIGGSQLQSNLFLPFGKVRMGYPLGKLGWVIILGGTDTLLCQRLLDAGYSS